MKDIVVRNALLAAGGFAFGVTMAVAGYPIWVTLAIVIAGGSAWDYYQKQQAMKAVDELLDKTVDDLLEDAKKK